MSAQVEEGLEDENNAMYHAEYTLSYDFRIKTTMLHQESKMPGLLRELAARYSL